MTAQPHPDKHPYLWAFLTRGIIRPEGSEFIGRASDGEWVSLGLVAEPDSVELYLEARPDPKHW